MSATPEQSIAAPERVDLDDLSRTLGVSQIDVKREQARQILAYCIVGCLGFIVIAAFISYWCLDKTAGQDGVEQLIKFTSALIAPVIGIVGAVTGFYFGAASNAGRRDENG